MKTPSPSTTWAGVAFLAVLILTQAAHAGTFEWGDFVGDDVMFLDVTENNSMANSLFAPMPGNGGPMVLGNSLHLDPQGFASQSQNNMADLIDSTLSTVIMAGQGGAIGEITITELGDYSLGGLAGGQASAEVGAAFFWTVLEVDDQPVNLDTQATNLIVSSGSGPNGGMFVRPGDDGTTVIWSGTASINVGAYLAGEQIDGSATKVRLTFDNALQTAADDVSTAFIKKKSIDIDVKVPEPATVMLLSVGLIALPFSRRRRVH